MENQKHFSTRFWGQMALVGIVAGSFGSSALRSTVSNPSDVQFLSITLGLLALLGWISLVVWIYRKVKKI